MNRKLFDYNNNSSNGCDISSLRSLIRNAIEQYMYKSAIFYAETLVSITNDDDDVHLLTEAYVLDGQYRRAVLLIRQRNLLNDRNLSFVYIVALCLSKCNEWDECITILGRDDDEFVNELDVYDNNNNDNNDNITKIKLTSALCIIRAKAYEAIENHMKRVFWLKEALKRDSKCIEAFEALIDKRTLKYDEEMKLLDEYVNVSDHMKWLKLIYEAKIDQYHYCTEKVSDKVIALQNDYGMNNNLELRATLAHYHYQRNRYEQCYDITKDIIQIDPYHHSVLPVHVCAMVELNMKSELFYCSHQLVEAYPDKAIAWFSVGCYYYLIENYDIARRYFSKATNIDKHFASAWIGVGHSYAALDESDQAMSAYRSASRLFEGSHIPLLCIGMEYVRSSQNQALASQFFTHAHSVCPIDPMVYNEIGVVSYNSGDYDTSVHYFTTSLELMPKTSNPVKEAVLVNLGHSYRKVGKYSEAVNAFELALGITSNNASLYSGLGFTHHLQGDLTTAIDCYHKALGIQPRDTFTNDMLSRAFNELLNAKTNWIDIK